MKAFLFNLSFLWQLYVSAQPAIENYSIDSASIERVGVPKGELLKFSFEQSKIFPGTWREYWVYIPAQYSSATPACVYISQDGVPYNAPVVFDNLIFKKEMPVTIGVFVRSGQVRAIHPETSHHRYTRSVEYDGLGDDYAKFLLNEILPDVETHTASDGRVIKLSKRANDRAIGGGSSGAIASFTAAWERPDEFSRVFSSIGGYINLRGGDRYPSLIRRYEPKPIRIFLQDGSNDANGFSGDLWKANEMMERALTFAGYQVQHVWGEGGHDGKHASAIFPAAMRWLWKDYPGPVLAGISKNQMLLDILIPGENWEIVGEGYNDVGGLFVNASGEIFYKDNTTAKNYKVEPDGKITTITAPFSKSSIAAFGPGDKCYVIANEKKKLYTYQDAGKPILANSKISVNDMVISNNGNIYTSSPGLNGKPGLVSLIRPGGERVLLDETLTYPNGVALTPDQSQLFVSESHSHCTWVYQIQPDGTLANKQRHGWLYMPDTAENAWPAGLQCDSAGRIYVTTRLGIQILDAAGRVNAILPLPAGQPFKLCFGGAGFNTLYITCKDRVYRRKLNTKGVNAFEKPMKPAKVVL